MAGAKEHWESVYRDRGEERVSWFQENPEPSLSFIKKYPDAASRGIIDIGAGASRLADALAGAGYTDITLLDISSRALEKTAKRIGGKAGGIDFIASDITAWHPKRKWGIWHDRAVFHFLTSGDDQRAYVKALREGTAPGSVIVMGTFSLEGPERCSGLPVQRYSAESLNARLGSEFELVESLPHCHVTPGGAEQNFMFAVFQRR